VKPRFAFHWMNFSISTLAVAGVMQTFPRKRLGLKITAKVF
jgi:hypothetical protein